MRIFTALCRESRGVMILSECSYNQACMFLQAGFGNPLYTSTDYEGNIHIAYLDRTFCYDENKGYLIEEDE